MKTEQPSFVTRRKAARATFPLKKGEGMKREGVCHSIRKRARFLHSRCSVEMTKGDPPVILSKGAKRPSRRILYTGRGNFSFIGENGIT